MAILCLTVDNKDICKKLNEIAVPGQKLDINKYHTTLFYMPQLKIEQVSQLLELTFNFLKDEHAFNADHREVTTFKTNKDGIPIIIPVISEYLHDWRTRLGQALDAAEISYDKKFPQFNPHVTLSYSHNKKDRDFHYIIPNPIEIHHNTVTYFGSHTGKTMFRIPIGGNKKSYDLLREEYQKALIENQNTTISFWEKSQLERCL